jgi:glycosyltransferase involved in cell wall biosynthesis
LKELKTIALVEWHWMGHHPMYFNRMILALEEIGMNVLALCPNPTEAAEAAEETRQKSSADSSQRGRTQFRKVKLAARRFSHLRSARISAMDWSIRHFAGIEKQVREWTRESGGKADAIFYSCMYDGEFEWCSVAQPFLRMPWMGLYLHAMSYRMPGRLNPHVGRVPCPERMFRGRLCKGITILDEGIVEQVSNSVGKPVVAQPDLTDERLAEKEKDRILGEQLKRFAAGRPIVGLFGSLQESKGVLTFLEAARMSESSKICFALGGEMYWNFDKEVAGQIYRTLAECPHVWNHLARIPGEPRLNDLLSTCDVIVAAYVDFPHSSGIQTKAAVLKKPIIVSDGYLMAERARRFNTGEIIPQGNAPALLDAILKIAQDPSAWVANHRPRWADYCHEHSFERLKASLKQLLDSI